MSEQEQQFTYIEDRVLIEASRVTSSDFPDIGVCLTGQELEVLRNLVSYATRRTTFVGEYHSGYYKVADDADWSVIEDVVANLERKIMGNDNTIWGYADRLKIDLSDFDVEAGDWLVVTTQVPVGQVYVVEAITVRNQYGDRGIVAISVGSGSAFAILVENPTPIALIVDTYLGRLTMKEGDTIRVFMASCEEGDRIDCFVWGYKMFVPRD